MTNCSQLVLDLNWYTVKDINPSKFVFAKRQTHPKQNKRQIPTHHHINQSLRNHESQFIFGAGPRCLIYLTFRQISRCVKAGKSLGQGQLSNAQWSSVSHEKTYIFLVCLNSDNFPEFRHFLLNTEILKYAILKFIFKVVS